MNGIKNLFLAVLLLSLGVCGFGQNGNPSENFWDNVRFGGGIGLGFGDGFFSGSLAPAAIYQFNPSFGLGVALNGSYASQKNIYKSTIFGGSVLGVYNPLREIQLSGEFEQLNVNRDFDDNVVFEDRNYWYPALYLGAGYNTGNVIFGIRYDVLYDEDKSIYPNSFAPFVRVFF